MARGKLQAEYMLHLWYMVEQTTGATALTFALDPLGVGLNSKVTN